MYMSRGKSVIVHFVNRVLQILLYEESLLKPSHLIICFMFNI